MTARAPASFHLIGPVSFHAVSLCRVSRRLVSSSLIWSGLALLALASPTWAGEADVMGVEAVCTTIRTCDFEVTVRHADIGWSHYAESYEIVSPEGEVLGRRVLTHPHVHEQPFVRQLVGVEIPEGVDQVVVRARDSKHGLGGDTVTKVLAFPPSGEKPTVTEPPSKGAE